MSCSCATFLESWLNFKEKKVERVLKIQFCCGRIYMIANNALFRSDSETELCPCVAPHREEFRLLLTRLGTFSNVWWPHYSLEVHPFQLAEAGFYYVGRFNQVKCWYCDCGLQRWNDHNNLWKEHAKFYPHCEFLLSHKGFDFVYDVNRQNPDLVRPLTSKLRLPVSAGFLIRNTSLNPTAVFDPSTSLRSRFPSCTTVAEKNSLEDTSSPASEPNSQDEPIQSPSADNFCKICYSEAINALFLPCSHIMCCLNCAMAVVLSVVLITVVLPVVRKISK